jgi:uncharacterized damage-inducible protein DinB
MDHVTLSQLLAYHHWAADRLLAALRAFPAEALARPIGGSFGSGQGLLAHIVAVEWIWLERWQGRSPSSLPDLISCTTAADFQREWETVKVGQHRFLRDLTDERLREPLTYTNLQGESWTYALWAVLVHLVNHGTYHRGQLANLLRQLEQVPPSTDYLLFLDEAAMGPR